MVHSLEISELTAPDVSGHVRRARSQPLNEERTEEIEALTAGRGVINPRRVRFVLSAGPTYSGTETTRTRPFSIVLKAPAVLGGYHMRRHSVLARSCKKN